MRKVEFGLWVMLIHLTAVLPLWAQKNLADWSITDDCTMQAAGFDADLTPLFDKDDLTAIQLSQLKGNEEIVMRAGRKYVLRGLSVVSADDEQQDLKQLAVYVSNDGQQWKLVRSLQLGFDRRFGVQQVNTPYSGAYEWFKLALKKSSGSSGLSRRWSRASFRPSLVMQSMLSSLEFTIRFLTRSARSDKPSTISFWCSDGFKAIL